MSALAVGRPAEPASSGVRGFRLLAALVVGVLLLAAVSLTVANAGQGPRLLSAQLDPAAAVQRAGQRLILQLDQPVADVAQVHPAVSPAAPVVVSSEGSSLVLRFTTALRYATAYAVVVPVRGSATSARSTLRYHFTTPPGSTYLLRRTGAADDQTPDEISRVTLGASGPGSVVYRARRIEQFAVAEPALAVVTLTGNAEGTLTVGRTDGTGPTRTLAEHAVVSQLHTTGPGGIFGYVVTTTAGSVRTRLELYNPITGAAPVVVPGLKGKPLEPADWAFVPGTSALIVQTIDSSIYLVDPTGASPAKPLGGHLKIYGFLPGTATLLVEDVDHFSTLDLAAGVTRALPSLDKPKDADISQLLPLDDRRGYVGLLVSLDADTNLSYAVAALGQGAARTLYATHPETSWVQNVCLSPNTELVAVETVPADAQSDAYDLAPGYPGTHTVFVETASGQIAADVPGFDDSWCD